jgi:hypothetical protein
LAVERDKVRLLRLRLRFRHETASYIKTRRLRFYIRAVSSRLQV